MKLILFILFVLTCSAFGCMAKETNTSEENIIGVATLLDDGTIILRLRTDSEGMVGEGYFEYSKDDPQYQVIMEHVGPLEVGEEKYVYPWDSD